MAVEKWSEDIVVVHLADDPQFSECMTSLEDLPGRTNMVLDFSAMGFMTSSNIASLLRLRKRATTEGGRVLLCSVPNRLWSVFMVTALDKLFEFSDNVSTGLATVQMKSGK